MAPMSWRQSHVRNALQAMDHSSLVSKRIRFGENAQRPESAELDVNGSTKWHFWRILRNSVSPANWIQMIYKCRLCQDSVPSISITQSRLADLQTIRVTSQASKMRHKCFLGSSQFFFTLTKMMQIYRRIQDKSEIVRI